MRYLLALLAATVAVAALTLAVELAFEVEEARLERDGVPEGLAAQ